MELVAFLGSDHESWGQCTALINHGEWENIIIIKNKDAQAYPAFEGAKEIIIDSAKPLIEIKKELGEKLKNAFATFEAHLSLASGNGKEHMALVAALLAVPVGIRLVAYTKNGIEVLS